MTYYISAHVRYFLPDPRNDGCYMVFLIAGADVARGVEAGRICCWGYCHDHAN